MFHQIVNPGKTVTNMELFRSSHTSMVTSELKVIHVSIHHNWLSLIMYDGPVPVTKQLLTKISSTHQLHINSYVTVPTCNYTRNIVQFKHVSAPQTWHTDALTGNHSGGNAKFSILHLGPVAHVSFLNVQVRGWTGRQCEYGGIMLVSYVPSQEEECYTSCDRD